MEAPQESSNPVSSDTQSKRDEKVMPSLVSPKTRLKASANEHGSGSMTLAGLGAIAVGVMRFDSQPGSEEMKGIILPRLLEIPRFHYKFVHNTIGAYFKHTPDLDENYHWRVISNGNNEEPTTLEQVDDMLSKVYSDKMDLSKPLWYFTYFPCVEGGGSVLVAAIDHTIGDGVALVEVLLSLVDKPDAVAGAGRTTSHRAPIDSKMRVTRRPVKKLGARTQVWLAVSGTVDAFTKVLQSADKKTAIRRTKARKGSALKRIGSSTPIALDRIKVMKSKVAGASVNDVFATVLSMTVRACLKEKNDPAFKSVKLRASFPVDMRPRKSKTTFKHGSPHNVTSFGDMKLVLKFADPVDCLRKTIRRLERVKRDPSPAVLMLTTRVSLPYLPVGINRILSNRITTLPSVYLSNVPGPQQKVAVGGVQLEDLSFYLLSNVGFYIGVISYAGKLTVNVVMDDDIEVTPQDVCRNWDAQFKLLEDALSAMPVL